MTCCICEGTETILLFFTHGVTFHLSPWSLLLYICFSLSFFEIVLLLYPLFCSHCHWNSSSLMLFFTQWQPECMAFLQSVVVSVYQYKHSCSTEMASPCFNYPSCQLRWKDTAPDKARPHSLILHRPFSHHQMQRRPSANSQMKPRHGCCPKHRANCTALSYWMPLTPHKWGLFYPDNCPRFSQALGICTSMVAGSCMNNISVKWLGSYLSQWLNFTLQLLQGDFIWCLNSTGSGGECNEIPERRQRRANMNRHAGTGRSVQADLQVMTQAQPSLGLWWGNPHNSFHVDKRLRVLMKYSSS